MSVCFTSRRLALSLLGNALRQHLEELAEDYVPSSTADYVNGKLMGRVKIEWLDAMVVTV